MTDSTSPLSYSDMISRMRTALGNHSVLPAETLKTQGKQYPLFALVFGQGNPKRALITAGIHGDEPAGVETILAFLERGLHQQYSRDWELTLVPCLNPSGLDRGTRETSSGIDLNRKFKEESPPAEVAFAQKLLTTPYDLDIELHEDVDSPGYYLYQKEIGTLSDLGRKILDAVSEVMAINLDEEIEEMPAERGLLARLSSPEEMEWWPMAIFANARGCRKAFTLETASCFPMETRVRAHLTALETALSD